MSRGTGGLWKAPGIKSVLPGWPLGRPPPGAIFSSELAGWLAPHLEKKIYNRVKDLFNTYSWDNLFKGGDRLCKVVERLGFKSNPPKPWFFALKLRIYKSLKGFYPYSLPYMASHSLYRKLTYALYNFILKKNS